MSPDNDNRQIREDIMITRRTLIVGSALAAGFASRSRAEDAARPITIAIGAYPFAYLPLLVAISAGFMKAEGLDVSLVNTGGGTNTMAAMLGGSVDVEGLVMSDL